MKSTAVVGPKPQSEPGKITAAVCAVAIRPVERCNRIEPQRSSAAHGDRSGQNRCNLPALSHSNFREDKKKRAEQTFSAPFSMIECMPSNLPSALPDNLDDFCIYIQMPIMLLEVFLQHLIRLHRFELKHLSAKLIRQLFFVREHRSGKILCKPRLQRQCLRYLPGRYLFSRHRPYCGRHFPQLP